MLKLLLKTRVLALVDQFSGQSKGKQAINVRKIALLACTAVLTLCLFGFLLSKVLKPLYINMAGMDMEWLYFAMVGGLAFLVSFMFTSIYAQGAIFEAKDNEMLLAMPIPPSAILGSRISALYILNAFFSVAFMGAAGVVKLTAGGAANIGGVILYVISAFLLALISTTLSCLLGWLVSLITRRIRRKAIFQMVFSLLLLGAFYAVFLGDINQHLKTITDNSEGIAGVFRGVLYPFYAMGVACTGKDIGMFLIFAACCIIPFALVCLALTKSFVRIVTTRSSVKKLKYEAKALRSSSPVLAMTKKELSRFFNSSSYMLNAGLGLVYSLGMTIMIVVSANSQSAGAASAAAGAAAAGPGFFENIVNIIGTDGLKLVFGLLLASLAAFSYISGPSISVESNNIWILKSSPVTASQVLRSKVYAHLIVALPFSLVCSVIMAAAIPEMGLFAIVFTFLMPLLAHIFCAHIGVIANLYLGKLNFPSIAKAVKSNSAALIPMLTTAVISLLPTILFFTVLKESGVSFRTIAVISLVLPAVLDTAMYAFLHSSAAQKRWDRVGQ